MRPLDADLVVVGLGPAGCACAVQAARAGLDVLGVDEAMTGGLIGAADRVTNLPLFPDGIDGRVLARRLVRSLRHPGVRTIRARVAAIVPCADDTWLLRRDGTAANELRARSVCVAAGTVPVDLPAWLAGASHDVHRDVRTLPASLQGRHAAVLGGGDAAFDTALGLTRRGGRVSLLVRAESPRAAAPLVRAVSGRDAIDLRLGWVAAGPVERRGDGWRLSNAGGGTLDVDVLVACLGRVPQRGLLDGLPMREDAPAWNPLPGLFVAGDLLRARDRFVAPALAEGLRAGDAAAAFLARGATP